MVLQRDRVVPIWGEGAPAESVVVEFGGTSVRTTAGTDGRWRVDLGPLSTSAEPRTLTIQGTNRFVFSDVLVGEVWFCSGQSNMEKSFGPVKGQKPVDNYETEVAEAENPRLRIYQVPRTDQRQTGDAVFHWLPCSPDALSRSKFSAAAYYFGRELTRELGVPVGLVHSSFGGSLIDAWMPPEAFANTPVLHGLEHVRHKVWVRGVQPTELYRDMIAPFVPFAVRGFLWYQGEANCMEADIALYAAKQRALIESWRTAWGDTAAPFYYVLLAPFDYSRWETFPKRLTREALPAFWEAQVKCLATPGAGLIVTTDLVKNLHDIHPTNKRDIGLRLARLALADTYGRSDVEAHSPQLESSRETDHGTMALNFSHADGLCSRDGKPLTDFTIAGEDRIFHPADAAIENNTIALTSPHVPKPIAVRFAWSETAAPNLVNAAGLPAIPFRTDDWPVQLERAESLKPSANFK